MNPLITIVITTYRRPILLKKALQSALNQTYANLEILVIDDNDPKSPEHAATKKVVNEFHGVRYLNNSRSIGGALSRNAGIVAAKGEFIAFLDDDDVYLPTKIEKQYKEYTNHLNDSTRTGLIYTYCKGVDKHNKIVSNYNNNIEGSPIYDQMMGCVAGTSLWFSPKDVLIDCGMFDDSPSKQDSILLLKMLVKGYQIFRVPEYLVMYMENLGDGISGSKITNIQGIIQYRKLCRSHYDLLGETKQISEIEYNFSKQLVSLYALNSLSKYGFSEFAHMVMQHPLRLDNIVALCKLIAPNMYKNHIKDGIK
jgi:glycosyltransferase involved in cell wall biosynthesis